MIIFVVNSIPCGQQLKFYLLKKTTDFHKMLIISCFQFARSMTGYWFITNIDFFSYFVIFCICSLYSNWIYLWSYLSSIPVRATNYWKFSLLQMSVFTGLFIGIIFLWFFMDIGHHHPYSFLFYDDFSWKSSFYLF